MDFRIAPITGDFGEFPLWRKLNGFLPHGGTDYAGSPLGEAITSHAPGELVYSGGGPSVDLGFFTIIDYGLYGLMACHQDRAYPELIGLVNPGDVIGYVGNTGKSTGPHVHLICSTKRLSNGRFDFSHGGGGLVSSRLMFDGGYQRESVFTELFTEPVPRGNVWHRVTKRYIWKSELELLDNLGVGGTTIQVAGQWTTVDPDNPSWVSRAFPPFIPELSAVFVNRDAKGVPA